METFSALLTLCEWNPTVTGGFPSQRPVTWSFDVFIDLRLKKNRAQTIEVPVIWDAFALIMTSTWCCQNRYEQELVAEGVYWEFKPRQNCHFVVVLFVLHCFQSCLYICFYIYVNDYPLFTVSHKTMVCFLYSYICIYIFVDVSQYDNTFFSFTLFSRLI